MYIIIFTLLFIIFILYSLLQFCIVEKSVENDIECGLPIYYINLDSSEDRKKNLIKEFEKYNIKNYRRIAGITPSIINPKYKKNFVASCPHQNELEFACLLSHLKSIHTAFKNGHEIALIVEDDMRIHRLINFKKLLQTAPKDWEILQMYAFNGDMYRNENDLWVPHSINNWSSLAYIINREGMIKVLSSCFNNYKNPNFEELDINWETFLKKQPCVADFLIYQIAKTYSCTDLFFTIPPNNDSTIHSDHLPTHQYHDNVMHEYFSKHGFKNSEIGYIR